MPDIAVHAFRMRTGRYEVNLPDISPLPITIPEGRGLCVFVRAAARWSSFMVDAIVEKPDLLDKYLRKACYSILKGAMPWPSRGDIEKRIAEDGHEAASAWLSEYVRAFDASLAVLEQDVRPLYDAAIAGAAA